MSPAVPAAAAPAPATTARRGRVVTPDRIIDDGAVVVTDRHIAWVGPAAAAGRAGFGDAVAAAESAPGGGYLLPGASGPSSAPRPRPGATSPDS